MAYDTVHIDNVLDRHVMYSTHTCKNYFISYFLKFYA